MLGLRVCWAKGWALLRRGADTRQASKQAAVLTKPQGVIFYQLMATPTSHADVQYVHGEMVIREGEYVTSDDLRLVLEGMYVHSLGLLRVSMNSELLEQLTEAEVGQSAGEYRKALRAAAAEAVRVASPPTLSWVLSPLSPAPPLSPTISLYTNS